MILLDTNVVSEASRPGGDANVPTWLDDQAATTLYLSAITIAELRLGVAIMSESRRRSALSDNLNQRILPFFAGRVLTFDVEAAEACAELRARCRATGKAIAVVDGFIAAIALAHDFAVATRDTAPFQAAGLRVINPWSI